MHDGSVFGDGLVEVENHVRNPGGGGEVGWWERGIDRRGPDPDEGEGVFGVAGEVGAESCQRGGEDAGFVDCRPATGGELKGERDATLILGAAFAEHAGRQLARSFEVT